MADLFEFPKLEGERREMAMFRTPAPRRSGKDAVETARRFGLAAEPEDLGVYLLFRDETATLELFAASDSLRYSRWPGQQEEGKDGVRPPEPDAAAELARRVLDEHGLGDESARRASVTPLEVSRIERDGREPAGKPETRTVAVHVNYAFELDGLPVLGPGAKIQVTLGHEGELLECLRFWRRPEQLDAMPVIEPAEAVKRLRRDPAYASLKPDGAKVVFHEATLAYLALPPRELQGYLLPVYAYRGTVSTRELERWEHTRYVVAVDVPPRELKRLRVVHRRAQEVL